MYLIYERNRFYSMFLSFFVLIYNFQTLAVGGYMNVCKIN